MFDIVEKKIGKEFPSVVNDIDLCILSGSTGGEITFNIGKYLINLETNNKEAYNILFNDITEYIDGCKKEGLNLRR